MTVKKLSRKAPSKKVRENEEQLIEQFIGGGGKTTEESCVEDESLSRFTIRMPPAFVKMVDERRKISIGNISRNTWILEAIALRLKNDDR